MAPVRQPRQDVIVFEPFTRELTVDDLLSIAEKTRCQYAYNYEDALFCRPQIVQRQMIDFSMLAELGSWIDNLIADGQVRDRGQIIVPS